VQAYTSPFHLLCASVRPIQHMSLNYAAILPILKRLPRNRRVLLICSQPIRSLWSKPPILDGRPRRSQGIFVSSSCFLQRRVNPSHHGGNLTTPWHEISAAVISLHEFQAFLSLFVALFRSFPVPLDGFLAVFVYPNAVMIHPAEIVLR